MTIVVYFILYYELNLIWLIYIRMISVILTTLYSYFIVFNYYYKSKNLKFLSHFN